MKNCLSPFLFLRENEDVSCHISRHMSLSLGKPEVCGTRVKETLQKKSSTSWIIFFWRKMLVEMIPSFLLNDIILFDDDDTCYIQEWNDFGNSHFAQAIKKVARNTQSFQNYISLTYTMLFTYLLRNILQFRSVKCLSILHTHKRK